MTKDEYFKMPGLSSTALSWFSVSPEYYQYMKRVTTESKQMALGSCLHYLLFEPDNFDDYMAVMDKTQMPEPTKDFRTKVNAEWRDAFIQRANEAGTEIIASDEYQKAKNMLDKLYTVPESRDLIKYTRSKFEQASTWVWNGITFKRKLDIDSDIFICDLKTAADASPAKFRRVIYDNGYYRQLGMYSDGDRIINGTSFHKEAYIIAIENTEPYGVSVHRLTDSYLDQGVVEYRNLAEKFVQCSEKNYWPTYPYNVKDGIELVDLPKWLQE